MEMIIGGACQGKGAYAEKIYPEIHWTDGETCPEEELFQAEGIKNFHTFIRRALKEEKDVCSLSLKLAEKNPDVILISDEVGYGVVPMDAFERAYREAVGRVCTDLAAKSRRVTRVVCGIGTVIKDA